MQNAIESTGPGSAALAVSPAASDSQGRCASTVAVEELTGAVFRHCAVADADMSMNGSGAVTADAVSEAGGSGGFARTRVAWTVDAIRRCLLFRVFCLASDGLIGEATALRAGSAPLAGDALEYASADVQVLNNRAQAAIGLAAFQRGEWQRALDYLKGFEYGPRSWMMVGQAVSRDRTRDMTDRAELQKARRDLWEERRRLVPAHRWISYADVCVTQHFSAMVVETPRRARMGAGGRTDDRMRAFLGRLKACVTDWRGSSRVAGQGSAAAEAEAAAAAAAEVGSSSGSTGVAAAVAAAAAAALGADDADAEGGSGRSGAVIARAGGAGAVAVAPSTVCEK